jgi:alpha-glucosidase
MVDNGYDIADYTDIDPRFGTLEDFDELVQKAHQQNLKVMLDFVPNHTSDQHPWFLESKSSKDNPKRDWYIWKDPKPDGSPPNNWISVFDNAIGAAWQWDEQTKQYYLHSFFPQQPDLNWRNPQVQQAMADVLRFWMNRGVDGFRVDVIYYLLKDERFLDEPVNPNYRPGIDHPNEILSHIYSKDQPDTLKLMGLFNDVLDEFGNKFMVSETYVSIAETIKIYTTSKSRAHAPFNFHLIFQPFEAKAYKAIIDEFQTSIAESDLPVYVLGNHDQSRIATRLGGQAQARIAAMLKLTLPGMPFVYYGDEIGMEDFKDIPDEKRNDKFGAVSRDPQRTPMQWNDSEYAGFSKHEPWLPIHPNYKKINVQAQESDSSSMLSLYKKLLVLRRERIEFIDGRYFGVSVENEPVLAYMRAFGDEQLLILLNFSHEKQTFRLPYETVSMLLNTFLDEKNPYIKQYSYQLRPYEGVIVQVR